MVLQLAVAILGMFVAVQWSYKGCAHACIGLVLR